MMTMICLLFVHIGSKVNSKLMLFIVVRCKLICVMYYPNLQVFLLL